jgi:hypothetical protein
MVMDMETSLACSSAASAALFAASFFSLSALLRVLVCRRSTSAAHLAFVQPGGLSFGACGFLAFDAPSSAIFFGGMVVDGERRSCNCGGMAVAPLKFGGENGYMWHILEGKRNKWRELLFLWPTPRACSTFHAFLFRPESPTAPRKAENSLGSPDGLRTYSKKK